MRRLTMPIFFAGMGSALEVCPLPFLYNIQRPFGDLSDGQRLASDWLRVGHALYTSLGSQDTERVSDNRKEPAATR